VQHEQTIILADDAERAEHLDEERVREARRRAEDKMRDLLQLDEFQISQDMSDWDKKGGDNRSQEAYNIQIGKYISDKVIARSRTVFTGNFIASMFVGVISIISFEIKLVDNLDNIIVGAALALVPGVAFTAGIRDFISGDLLSGIARIGEAILVAIAIAFGVGRLLMLYSIFGGL